MTSLGIALDKIHKELDRLGLGNGAPEGTSYCKQTYTREDWIQGRVRLFEEYPE